MILCKCFFVQMLSVYRPKGLKVIGAMSLVRNSVGSGLQIQFFAIILSLVNVLLPTFLILPAFWCRAST